MAYVRQTFIYNDADKSSSKDLQSLRFHLNLLFDIQRLLTTEQVGKLLPTSEELIHMLADLDEVEIALKIMFKTDITHQDILTYSSLAEEILKRVKKAIPKLTKGKIQLKEYENYKGSLDSDELERADKHLDLFLAACKESCDLLGDIKLNAHYQKMLSLLRLTNI